VSGPAKTVWAEDATTFTAAGVIADVENRLAAHHMHLVRGHHEHAMHHAAEAAEAHIEDHGKAIPARA